MKIIKQSASVISGLSPMEHIERIGRICYKSEDKITDTSSERFVSILFKRNHHAMLEHYRFIAEVTESIYKPLSTVTLKHFELTNDGRYLVSFSARSLINMVEESNCTECGILPMTLSGIRDELIYHVCRTFKCNALFGKSENDRMTLSTTVNFIPNSPNKMSAKEWIRHGWKSICFVTDRGVSHELVRHREGTSFAQESTRYCNYCADKFGHEITVIDQGFSDGIRAKWECAMRYCEEIYFGILNYGETPQIARAVLPTCLKTEIVMTAPIYEWQHVVNLRYYGATGSPHPMIRELFRPLVEGGTFDYAREDDNSYN